MSDLFIADGAMGQQQQKQDNRVDGRGDEMSSAMAVSNASIRNPDVETLGELETGNHFEKNCSFELLLFFGWFTSLLLRAALDLLAMEFFGI